MAFSGLKNHRKVVSGRLDGGLEEEKESEEFGGKGMKANVGEREWRVKVDGERGKRNGFKWREMERKRKLVLVVSELY